MTDTHDIPIYRDPLTGKLRPATQADLDELQMMADAFRALRSLMVGVVNFPSRHPTYPEQLERHLELLWKLSALSCEAAIHKKIPEAA